MNVIFLSVIGEICFLNENEKDNPRVMKKKKKKRRGNRRKRKGKREVEAFWTLCQKMSKLRVTPNHAFPPVFVYFF